MSKLINNIVKMDRGDSYDLDVTINNGDSFYTLKDNDKLYFALMEPNCEFEDAVLYKILTSTSDPLLKENGKLVEYHINLEPNDTVHLTPGVYYYTIKLKMDHPVIDDKTGVQTAYIKEVYTVIDRSKFIILGATPSVTPTTRRVEYKLIDKEITENGRYVAADELANGYSTITVNIPHKIPCIVQGDSVRSSFTVNGEPVELREQGYIVMPGDVLSTGVKYGVCLGEAQGTDYVVYDGPSHQPNSDYIVPEDALYVIVEEW